MKDLAFRVGQGIDVHRYGPGDHVVLCGVNIPYEQGIVAHSDGDVALHALADALLGALALGDIGQHFPDHDERWRGADSRMLLRHVMSMVSERGWQVGNADLTILAERPKIAPWIDSMKQNLAEDLRVATDVTSVKATTTERLGFVGRGEGIAVWASVLLYRQETKPN